mmetsp:Transcript_21522/g.41963  ORF Transcript_21522/g.41963 Transcript_21522/m.41963 type:complete len:328 (+) Transcript_21522:122-1105(+)
MAAPSPPNKEGCTARTGPPAVSALLGSLILFFLTTVFSAFLHVLRLALFFIPRQRAAHADRAAVCSFYEGKVVHTRRAPMNHRFEYDVRYCLVDLDAAKPPACCVGQLEGRLSAAEARAFTRTEGNVQLLLLPASAGYDQNPICVYYCHSAAGELCCCIAEVTNTPWGDRVRFAFDPRGDVLPKPMHVSPLQDMNASWSLRSSKPSETLSLQVACKHPALGNFFTATLSARRTRAPADSQRWALLMPHKVSVWIYYHAALLLWRGLPFLGHPKYEDRDEYKRRAVERAKQHSRLECPALGRGQRVGADAAPDLCPFAWSDATIYPWN